MEHEELINVTVYDPSVRGLFKAPANDRSECKKYWCDNKGNCGLYKRNECLQMVVFGFSGCPHGRRSFETGFTKRARKFRAWVSERKEKYADHLWKLKSPTSLLAMVGDYIYLPYAHMSMNGHVFEDKSTLFHSGSGLLPIANFTTEAIVSIAIFRPQAMMGGEIKTYQSEVVPLFLQHLKEKMPERYNMLPSELLENVTEYSAVGRKALLSSLLPGTVVKKKTKKESWIWDGKYLTSNNPDLLFPFVKYEKAQLILTPKEGTTIEITDDNQVSADTVFMS